MGLTRPLLRELRVRPCRIDFSCSLLGKDALKVVFFRNGGKVYFARVL